MTPDLRLDAATGLRYRPAAADRWVIRESAYRPLLRALTPADRVLDLGAHVGSFAVPAARVAGRVLAVEPDPANLEVLRRNVAALGNVEVAAGAAVPAPLPGGVAALWRSPAPGGDAYSSLRAKRGYRPVPVRALPLADLAARVRPTAVKVDVEGAEYDLLEALDPAGVELLAVEYTLQPAAARRRALAAHARLEAAGLRASRPFAPRPLTRSQVRLYGRRDRLAP